MNSQTVTIKSSGATFTPAALADFLSDKILKYADAKESVILDPACGDGALLV
jgi:type I restriction-modification system DNA methylase subunit